MLRERPSKRWAWRLVSAGIAALAIVAIVWRYSPAQIAAEMARGETLAMLPYGVALALSSLPLVAAADRVVIARSLERPTFGEIVRGVAGSAILNVFGYAAGLSGYALWVARLGGVSLSLAAGIVLYIVTTELSAALLFAGVAIHTGGVAVDAGLAWGIPLVATALIAAKIVRPGWLLRIAERADLSRGWRAMRPRDALMELAIRLVQLSLLVVGTWLAARAYGWAVPLPAMAALLPVVILVGALPVNVAGFGAVQGAWLLFLPWAESGEQLLAFAVSWQLLNAALVVLRGLPFIRGVVGDVAGR